MTESDSGLGSEWAADVTRVGPARSSHPGDMPAVWDRARAGVRGRWRSALGLAGGRWAWDAFARQLGVPSRPEVPALALLLLVPGALVVANAAPFLATSGHA